MLTKIVFITLLSLAKGWPFGKGASRSTFDPDVDLCSDPSLNGGVVAEDGETYIFKGKFYWRTRSLTRDSGIIGYANLISSKWPEITSNIRLVFTVPKDNALMTVFVVQNDWFGYQKGLKVMQGTVDSWPNFKVLKITAAFTPLFAGTLVFVLYADNDKYTLYDFADISKPTKVRSGNTTIRENYLVFAEDSARSMPGASIKTLIDVRAGLTYKDKLFLVSKQTFCAISLSAQSYERECKPKNVNELLGCPLDISARPSLAVEPTNLETIGVRPTSSAIEVTSKYSTHFVTVIEPIPSNWELNESNSVPNAMVRTGIPILGRELVDEEFNDGNSTSQLAGGKEVAIYEKNRQNSMIWFIVFVVGLVAVSLSTILVVGMVSRVRNKKKSKGEVVNIK